MTNDELLQVLIEYFADKKHDMAKECIGLITDINEIIMYDKLYRNVLTVIAASDDITAVEMLLEAGADINKELLHGIAAIMYAFQNDHLDIVKLLYDKGQ